MVNVQDKGKRGEREIKDRFIAIMEAVERDCGKTGYSSEVKRASYMASNAGGRDIVGIPCLAVEVKRAETLELNAWWNQCERQARENELPVLLFRQSRRPWRCLTYGGLYLFNDAHRCVVQCSADDFFNYFAKLYLQILHRPVDTFA